MGVAGSGAGTGSTSAPVSVWGVATARSDVSVTDAELMREALTALQGVETTGINEYESRGVLRQIVLRVRPVIAKLEERLLRE